MKSVLRFAIVPILWHAAFVGLFHAADGAGEINQACAVNTGCFPGDTAGFPVTIDTKGSYVLTGNLTLPDQNTTGISIVADGVTVDLGGFSIEGVTTCTGGGSTINCTPSGSGRGISTAREGIEIRNGTVKGSGWAGVDHGGSEAIVENIRAVSNGGNGIRVGWNSRVSGCVVDRNGGHGIVTSINSIVTDSVARDSGLHGIFCGGVNSPFLASRNVASENGFDGISCGGQSTIVQNASFNNEDDGIEAGFASTVNDNSTMVNDGDGIEVGDGSIVSNSTARLNGAFGINMGADCGYRGNVLSGNTSGHVSGGLDLGNNACDGMACP